MACPYHGLTVYLCRMDQGLSEHEFAVLDCLYFVEPFDKIVEETGLTPAIVGDVLKTLIHKKWVVPMAYKPDTDDYISTFFYDSDHMGEYRYLATREGLLKHVGR